MENLNKMEELLTRLSGWLEKQKQGELDLESTEKAADDARIFYENWVYLKFDKLKIKKNSDPISSSFKEAFSISKNTIKKEPLAVEKTYDDKDNLETDSPIASENQTTLIEIIEEIQEDQNINDRIAKGQAKETLAIKHAKKPIRDLEKSIGINQKFSFIKHLFNNNKEAYSEAMRKLNSSASFLEADDYIQNHLKINFNWEDETVHVIKFIELVERRYLT